MFGNGHHTFVALCPIETRTRAVTDGDAQLPLKGEPSTSGLQSHTPPATGSSTEKKKLPPIKPLAVRVTPCLTKQLPSQEVLFESGVSQQSDLGSETARTCHDSRSSKRHVYKLRDREQLRTKDIKSRPLSSSSSSSESEDMFKDSVTKHATKVRKSPRQIALRRRKVNGIRESMYKDVSSSETESHDDTESIDRVSDSVGDSTEPLRSKSGETPTRIRKSARLRDLESGSRRVSPKKVHTSLESECSKATAEKIKRNQRKQNLDEDDLETSSPHKRHSSSESEKSRISSTTAMKLRQSVRKRDNDRHTNSPHKRHSSSESERSRATAMNLRKREKKRDLDEADCHTSSPHKRHSSSESERSRATAMNLRKREKKQDLDEDDHHTNSPHKRHSSSESERSRATAMNLRKRERKRDLNEDDHHTRSPHKRHSSSESESLLSKSRKASKLRRSERTKHSKIDLRTNSPNKRQDSASYTESDSDTETSATSIQHQYLLRQREKDVPPKHDGHFLRSKTEKEPNRIAEMKAMHDSVFTYESHHSDSECEGGCNGEWRHNKSSTSKSHSDNQSTSKNQKKSQSSSTDRRDREREVGRDGERRHNEKRQSSSTDRRDREREVGCDIERRCNEKKQSSSTDRRDREREVGRDGERKYDEKRQSSSTDQRDKECEVGCDGERRRNEKRQSSSADRRDRGREVHVGRGGERRCNEKRQSSSTDQRDREREGGRDGERRHNEKRQSSSKDQGDSEHEVGHDGERSSKEKKQSLSKAANCAKVLQDVLNYLSSTESDQISVGSNTEAIQRATTDGKKSQIEDSTNTADRCSDREREGTTSKNSSHPSNVPTDKTAPIATKKAVQDSNGLVTKNGTAPNFTGLRLRSHPANKPFTQRQVNVAHSSLPAVIQDKIDSLVKRKNLTTSHNQRQNTTHTKSKDSTSGSERPHKSTTVRENQSVKERRKNDDLGRSSLKDSRSKSFSPRKSEHSSAKSDTELYNQNARSVVENLKDDSSNRRSPRLHASTISLSVQDSQAQQRRHSHPLAERRSRRLSHSDDSSPSSTHRHTAQTRDAHGTHATVAELTTNTRTMSTGSTIRPHPVNVRKSPATVLSPNEGRISLPLSISRDFIKPRKRLKFSQEESEDDSDNNIGGRHPEKKVRFADNSDSELSETDQLLLSLAEESDQEQPSPKSKSVDVETPSTESSLLLAREIIVSCDTADSRRSPPSLLTRSPTSGIKKTSRVAKTKKNAQETPPTQLSQSGDDGEVMLPTRPMGTSVRTLFDEPSNAPHERRASGIHTVLSQVSKPQHARRLKPNNKRSKAQSGKTSTGAVRKRGRPRKTDSSDKDESATDPKNPKKRKKERHTSDVYLPSADYSSSQGSSENNRVVKKRGTSRKTTSSDKANSAAHPKRPKKQRKGDNSSNVYFSTAANSKKPAKEREEHHALSSDRGQSGSYKSQPATQSRSTSTSGYTNLSTTAYSGNQTQQRYHGVSTGDSSRYHNFERSRPDVSSQIDDMVLSPEIDVVGYTPEYSESTEGTNDVTDSQAVSHTHTTPTHQSTLSDFARQSLTYHPYTSNDGRPRNNLSAWYHENSPGNSPVIGLMDHLSIPPRTSAYHSNPLRQQLLRSTNLGAYSQGRTSGHEQHYFIDDEYEQSQAQSQFYHAPIQRLERQWGH